MGSRSNVGGVFSVEMWLAKDGGRGNPPSPLDSVRVPIISALSGYNESVSANGGVVKVEHTLTLVTEATDNFWGNIALEGAQSTGCLARVELSSSREILLGWSPNLGYDQPLRLTKVAVQSVESVNQSLNKTWVFKSYSTRSLV